MNMRSAARIRKLAHRFLVPGAIAVALLHSSDLALACPKCLGSSDAPVLRAYFWTAALLSSLPLGIIGGIVYTLRRLGRSNDDPAARSKDPDPR